jgi:hypothetical protein
MRTPKTGSGGSKTRLITWLLGGLARITHTSCKWQENEFFPFKLNADDGGCKP